MKTVLPSVYAIVRFLGVTSSFLLFVLHTYNIIFSAATVALKHKWKIGADLLPQVNQSELMLNGRFLKLLLAGFSSL